MKCAGPVAPVRAKCSVLSLALLAATAVGCTGYLGGDSGSGDTPPGGPSQQPGGTAGSSTGGSAAAGSDCQAPAPMRRLTNFEYQNTLSDLFSGVDVGEVGRDIPGDVVDRGYVFDNRATTQGLSATHVDAYGQVAERLAELATADAQYTGCDPTTGTDACFDAFLAKFGERAFRRPLLPDETARIVATFAQVKAGLGFRQGVQAAIERVLQSPQFLYRLEPESRPVGQPRVSLSGHELATRLSYLVLGSTPDAELLAAAKSGGLTQSAGLRAQSERLLSTARGRANFQHLFDQWLELDAVLGTNKDMQLYPRFAPEIARAMVEEARTFLGQVLLDGEGGFRQLWSADFTYVNQPLAQYYGLTPAPPGDAFQKVMLPASRAAGILGQGAFATLHASDKTSHPIKRGVFTRTRVLCDALPPPPGNIPPAPMFTGHETARELMAKHSAAVECKGCHDLIDPIGLGFENLDAAGVWRDTDVDGMPVDASGAVLQGGDAEGAFVGVAELGQRLAASQKVQKCVATQYFRFGLGREPTQTDQCTLDRLASAVEGAGDFKALVLSLIESDAFAYRTE